MLRARVPGADRRHAHSWRSAAVADQMLELAERQLAAPAAVPPFAAFVELLQPILGDATLPSPARFLDIGCGVGAYADLLDEHAPGRFAYVGADDSEEVLAAARRRRPASVFERRDIWAPGALSGFDVVLASALLDVLPDPDRALAALLRAEARWVILHRQRIGRRGTHVAVVGGYRGQTTYSTSMRREALESAGAAAGRRVVASVPVEGDVWSFAFLRD
jgi:trans-aconitate methyltransferase